MGLDEQYEIGGSFEVECRSDTGTGWILEFHNLVTNEALQYIINQVFGTPAAPAGWWLGLKTSGAVLATDTMSSKAWGEAVGYTPTTRVPFAAVPAGLARFDNPVGATFTITAEDWIRGIFLVSRPTKGDTSGVLYSVGDFGTSRKVYPNDTLTVRYSTGLRRFIPNILAPLGQ